jgi:hypothetical protein
MSPSGPGAEPGEKMVGVVAEKAGRWKSSTAWSHFILERALLPVPLKNKTKPLKLWYLFISFVFFKIHFPQNAASSRGPCT